LPDGRLDVEFDTPQRAVTPGQSAVFYRGTRCLGGAVIATLRKAPLSPRDSRPPL
jgi:tRNA-specific 2-thiouridylase